MSQRYYFKRSILLIRQAILLLTFSISLSAKESITLATEDFPPYEYIENGEIKGLDIEIIKAASKRLDINVNFTFMPWKRALDDLERGKVDGMFSMFITPERKKFTYFSEAPLGRETNILITYKHSNQEINRLEDLDNLYIGIVAGNVYGDHFDHRTSFKRVEVMRIDQLIEMALRPNRFDAAVVNELVFSYLVKKNGYQKKFKRLKYVVSSEPMYLGFSKAKGSSHLLLSQRYAKAIKQLREQGIIDNIIGKYQEN